MKSFFNVKKVVTWALILLIALSLPFSVSAAKGGNGNQGNKGSQVSQGNKDNNSDKKENRANQSNEEKQDKSSEENEETELQTSDDLEKETDIDEQGKKNNEKKSKKEIKEQLKEARKQAKQANKEARKQLKSEAVELVALLEEEEDFDEALEVQTDVVQLDLKDKSAYKKLGHLYDKSRGNKGMKVFVNGTHPVFDVPPVVKYGRTLIPLRAVSNSLNAEVDWNAEEKKITVTKDGVEIVLYLGENTAYINGEEITLDVPAETENSRTIVPIRFISEAFNAYVDWEEETDSVIIVEDDEVVEEDPATDPVADEEGPEGEVVEEPTTDPEGDTEEGDTATEPATDEDDLEVDQTIDQATEEDEAIEDEITDSENEEDQTSELETDESSNPNSEVDNVEEGESTI